MQIGWGMPPSWSVEMDWGGGGEMDSTLLTSCSLHPSPFIGATAAYGVPKRSLEEFGEYYYEGGCIEKKRRLTVEQVRLLESSFERENKLEPEKKLQLAQKLGLEPRQVSVWFQNRRARSKSKRLELSFDSLKANYDSVSAEVDKLRYEVAHLNALLRAKNENESVATAAKPLVKTTEALEGGDEDEDEDKEDESSFAPIATIDVARIKQDSPPLGGGTATSDYSGSDNSQWLLHRPVFLEEEEEEECLHHHHNNNMSPSDVTDCVAAATAVYDVASSPDTRTGDEIRPCCIDGYADYADAAALEQQQDSFSALFPNESWLW